MTRQAGGVPDGVAGHPELVRLAALLASNPGRVADAPADARRAAVAILVRDRDGILEILLIKRAEYESDPWSGHVALPGGRMEPGDVTLEDTAVRETREEIGIDLRVAGTVIGTLDEVHPRTPVLPPVVVRPFVVAMNTQVQPSPSAEVADVFWVGLEALRAPGAWQPSTVRAHGTDLLVTSYRHGSYVVWGLTERVLRSLTLLLEKAPDETAIDNGTE